MKDKITGLAFVGIAISLIFAIGAIKPIKPEASQVKVMRYHSLYL